MKEIIDLRSDTVTKPTPEMRKAMYEAEVGDDVLREDPTVNKLEALSADLLGKEAAIFVPSGTFGNQLALFTHCTRGNEVILSETSHIVEHEAGAASMLASVQLRTIEPDESWLRWDEVKRRIRSDDDIHHPQTGCIALENALGNGAVQPIEELEKIAAGAAMFQVPVHLDGARIFNAALALGIDAAELACCTDSVMFCLSKGLCAPVGSMLAGSEEFIYKARKLRKVMGGGMRQAGILAAAGIVALKEMRGRLLEDHNTAEMLASVFAAYDLFDVPSDRVRINMAFVGISRKKDPETRERLAEKLVSQLAERGVLVYEPTNGEIRFVTHYGITEQHIGYIENILTDIADQLETR